jgi:lysophospholipase L1-like esterase
MLAKIAIALVAVAGSAGWSQDRMGFACAEDRERLTGIAQAAPVAAGATIVILGSSTAAGAGASRSEKSWAALLSAALASRGYAVVNRSVAGDTTGGTLARFARDVTPLKPAFVVLATSIYNEGINVAPATSWTTYVNNLDRLIAMTQSIGATPIVMGQYPNNGASAQVYGLVQTLYRQLNAAGVRVWDFLNSVEDAKGHWLPGLTSDGTHPTDQGHAYLFDAIPLTSFDPVDKLRGGRSRAADESPCMVQQPLTITFSRPATSWSIGAFVRPSNVSRTLLAAPEIELAVTYDGSYLALWQAGEIQVGGLVGSLASGDWHEIYVSRKHATNRIDVYFDGVSVGFSDQFFAGAISRVTLPASVPCFGDLCGAPSVVMAPLFRTPLNSGNVEAIHRGAPIVNSVEVWRGWTRHPARGRDDM